MLVLRESHIIFNGSSRNSLYSRTNSMPLPLPLLFPFVHSVYSFFSYIHSFVHTFVLSFGRWLVGWLFAVGACERAFSNICDIAMAVAIALEYFLYKRVASYLPMYLDNGWYLFIFVFIFTFQSIYIKAHSISNTKLRFFRCHCFNSGFSLCCCTHIEHSIFSSSSSSSLQTIFI